MFKTHVDVSQLFITHLYDPKPDFGHQMVGYIRRIRGGISSGAKERALKIMEIQEASSIDLSGAGSEGSWEHDPRWYRMGSPKATRIFRWPKSHEQNASGLTHWRLGPLWGPCYWQDETDSLKHALAAWPIVSNLDSRFAGSSVDRIFILWLSIWPRNLIFWSIPVSIASW
jgi:hypothetical protein